MKIFVTVYNLRSFTRAAEELYTSQPTISEHIQNLESRLKCKLFDRLGRTILPTAEAELLYPGARKILEDLQQLEEDVSHSNNTVAGKLIIGASTIPGTYLLPRLAALFKQQYPEISFEIRIKDTAAIVHSVANHEFTLGVVGAKIQSPKVCYQPINKDELILSAAYESLYDSSIRLDQLSELPFITREKGSGTRKTMENLLLAKQFTPEKLGVCATLGSSAAVKEAIKADLGVSIISKLAVEDELKNKTIRQIHIEKFQMERTFFLITPAKRRLPNSYQQFIHSILQHQ